MAEIRWDYEQISSFVDQLEACIDVLKDQQTFLKRFQADAAGSWASEAGQLYGERLDVDIEEIGNAVRTFESAKNQLRQTKTTNTQKPPQCSRSSLRPRQQTAALSRRRATAPTLLSRPIPCPSPSPPMTLGKAPCRSRWKSWIRN